MSFSTILRRSRVLTNARGGLPSFTASRSLSTRRNDLEPETKKDNILPVSDRSLSVQQADSEWLSLVDLLLGAIACFHSPFASITGLM
jgi:hypothetical protein